MADMSIDFKGWESYLDMLKEIGDDAFSEQVATECLEAAFDIFTPELVKAWEPHNTRFSGNTGRQIRRKAVISGTPKHRVWSVRAGFEIDKYTLEGMPSIYNAYGSPTTKPDTNLRNVMTGKTTKARINRSHKEILTRRLKEKL